MVFTRDPLGSLINKISGGGVGIEGDEMEGEIMIGTFNCLHYILFLFFFSLFLLLLGSGIIISIIIDIIAASLRSPISLPPSS